MILLLRIQLRTLPLLISRRIRQPDSLRFLFFFFSFKIVLVLG